MKWATFGAAVQAFRAKRGGAVGIGFVFAKDGGYCGVDLDDCRNPETGELEPFAAEIVGRFSALHAFVEVSPSQCGVKLITRGGIPGPRRRKGRIEMYQDGRYFTVTGAALGDPPAKIGDGQTALDWLYSKTFADTPKTEAPKMKPGPEAPLDLDDAALIEKAKAAKNGAKFAALWAGETSGYDGDDSAADLALCSLLAFWTGKDAERMDRLFRRSGLFRPKWEREDYRARTIARAIENTVDVYSPSRNGDPRPLTTKAKAGKASEAGGSADAEHLTDLGNARRLVRLSGGDLRYVGPWRKWLLWNGRRWEPDPAYKVVRYFDSVLEELYKIEARLKTKLAEIHVEGLAEVLSPDNETEEERKARKAERDEFKKLNEQAKEISACARRSETRQAIEAAVALARSRREVNVTPADLDRDPWALNVLNGTLDLRAAELRPHTRGDLLTKLVGVEYDMTATAPTFEQFLLEIMEGKPHLVEYLRRVLGYAITGDVREDALWIFHGGGANGKSTLLGAIGETLGADYGGTIAPELLLKKRSDGAHPTGLADLFGKRLVYTHEIDEGRALAEGLVKQLTGRDRVKARRMREDFWEFDPSHKIILATNHRPEIQGADFAIWRRIRLVPFNVTIPPEKQDKELPAKLRAEQPGILAWLVRGAVEWSVKGLADPPEVIAATAAYRAEADPLADFLAECCVTGSNQYRTRAGALYEAFSQWYRRERGGEPMSGTMFGKRVAEKFRRDEESAGRWFVGVGLREVSP